MAMLCHRFWPLLALLATYAIILILYPLQMQAVEPYAYAAAAEGYYNLTTTFALFQPGLSLPNISAYHPNHPLGHLLPALAHRAWGFDAMAFARLRNGAAAMIFLVFFCLSARLLVRKTAVIIAGTALLLFTYVFWSSALSGETHMPALCLLMVATYFLLQYLRGKGKSRPGYLIAAAAAFVLAGGCHLTSVLFVLPAGIAVLMHSHRWQRWSLYLPVAAFIALGYIFFYGILLVLLLKIDSLDTYLRTLFIYKPILIKKYATAEWWYLTGKSLLHSLAYTETAVGLFTQLAILVLIATGYWALLRSKITRPIKVLLCTWPLSIIVIQILVNGRPDGLHFWLFLLPPFFLAILFSLRCIALKFRTNIFLFAAVMLLGCINFFTTILPNSTLKSEQYTFTHAHQEFTGSPPVAFVISQPVLTFTEIWTAGTRYGLKNQTAFLPCCGEKEYVDHFYRWADGKSGFLIFADVGISEITEGLNRNRIGCQIIQDTTADLHREWIPVSVYLPPGSENLIRKRLQIYSCKRH